MSALTDRICGEYIQWWTKTDVLHDDSERVFYSLAEVEYIAATAAAMSRDACIAAVEALRGLTDDELLAPRALPETNEEWVSKARILVALREVQP